MIYSNSKRGDILQTYDEAQNAIPRLEMKGISKTFDTNIVLKGVDLELKEGEVLALLGENGAGKSTLIKILNGDYSKDTGTIFLDGIEHDITEPSQAKKLGIQVIYQELNYVPDMTVIENVLIGSFPRKNRFFFDWKKAELMAETVLDSLGADVNLYSKLSELSIANKQLV